MPWPIAGSLLKYFCNSDALTSITGTTTTPIYVGLLNPVGMTHTLKRASCGKLSPSKCLDDCLIDSYSDIITTA